MYAYRALYSLPHRKALLAVQPPGPKWKTRSAKTLTCGLLPPNYYEVARLKWVLVIQLTTVRWSNLYLHSGPIVVDIFMNKLADLQPWKCCSAHPKWMELGFSHSHEKFAISDSLRPISWVLRWYKTLAWIFQSILIGIMSSYHWMILIAFQPWPV